MNSHQPQDAVREILWNVSAPVNSVVMYTIFTASAAVCAWGVWRRFLLWQGGREDRSRFGAWHRRFWLLWRDVLWQRKVNREREPAVFHTLIFWGFIVLLFTTTMVFLDHDLGLEIYRGRFYLAVTLLSDLFGVGLLFGVCYAFYFRYIEKPDRLHSTLADAVMLLLLGLLVLQGFLLEGMRVYVTSDPWARYSPIGYLVSLGLWHLDKDVVKGFHYFVWWFHTITVFAFIAFIPYSKFFHLIGSSANLYFRDLARPKGALRHPGDIEALMEQALEDSEEDFRIGVATIEDLTWKQRLDLDACTSCGRCQAVCPAYNSGKALSPKWLVLDSRNHMLGLFADGKLPTGHADAHPLSVLDRGLLKSFLVGQLELGRRDPTERARNPLVQHAAKHVGVAISEKLAGGVMDEDVFWSCTTCRACMEVCPVGIEHVDLIVETRRSMALMDGNIPSEAQASLRAIETRGNPFGPQDQRADWTDGLQVPVLAPGDAVDVLYWVGCVSSFDKRKQKIARSMAKILNASGLRWGILGTRERCTGDPARRLGEENLFQSSAKQNIATLKEVTFGTLVANCPHCFNTIKNEYPQVEGTTEVAKDSRRPPFRVVHHSQLIRELLDGGKLVLEKTEGREITFHDPCYLGRYNDVYDQPRDTLVQIGGNKALREMKDSRERGMCCGAGGGHYWFDMKVGQRVNVLRAEQAAATGAELVATGCPFCMQMMEDGIKLSDREASMEVRDLAELVADALA